MEICRIKVDDDIIANIMFKCYDNKPYINYHIPIKNIYLERYQVIKMLESIISPLKDNYPYISLYCNKTNDLHIYIDSVNSDINDVCISNISLKTQYYTMDFNKIIFHD